MLIRCCDCEYFSLEEGVAGVSGICESPRPWWAKVYEERQFPTLALVLEVHPCDVAKKKEDQK